MRIAVPHTTFNAALCIALIVLVVAVAVSIKAYSLPVTHGSLGPELTEEERFDRGCNNARALYENEPTSELTMSQRRLLEFCESFVH